ncbi:hypothetical protein HYV73_01455 [Candidatus Uhrbacteria bacterium]|nr:hypothetical protein [Candidatus Uhrbacteria bacterium]
MASKGPLDFDPEEQTLPQGAFVPLLKPEKGEIGARYMSEPPPPPHPSVAPDLLGAAPHDSDDISTEFERAFAQDPAGEESTQELTDQGILGPAGTHDSVPPTAEAVTSVAQRLVTTTLMGDRGKGKSSIPDAATEVDPSLGQRAIPPSRTGATPSSEFAKLEEARAQTSRERKRFEELYKQATELRGEVNDLRVKVEPLKAELPGLEARAKAAKEAEANARAEVAQLTDQVGQLDTRKARLEAEIEEMSVVLSTSNNELKDIDSTIEIRRHDLGTLEEKIETGADVLEAMGRETDASLKKMAEAKSATAGAETYLLDLSSQIENREGKRDELGIEISKLIADRKAAASNLTQLEANLEGVRTELNAQTKQLEGIVAKKEAALAELSDKVTQKEAALAAAEEGQRRVMEETKKQQEALAAINAEIGVIEKDLTAKKAQRDAIAQQVQEQTNALESLKSRAEAAAQNPVAVTHGNLLDPSGIPNFPLGKDSKPAPATDPKPSQTIGTASNHGGTMDQRTHPEPQPSSPQYSSVTRNKTDKENKDIETASGASRGVLGIAFILVILGLLGWGAYSIAKDPLTAWFNKPAAVVVPPPSEASEEEETATEEASEDSAPEVIPAAPTKDRRPIIPTQAPTTPSATSAVSCEPYGAGEIRSFDIKDGRVLLQCGTDCYRATFAAIEKQTGSKIYEARRAYQCTENSCADARKQFREAGWDPSASKEAFSSSTECK